MLRIPTVLLSRSECALRYVAFLCARLMEVSLEKRALHIIQKHWRLSRLRSAGAPCDDHQSGRATSACWPPAPLALLADPPLRHGSPLHSPIEALSVNGSPLRSTTCVLSVEGFECVRVLQAEHGGTCTCG